MRKHVCTDVSTDCPTGGGSPGTFRSYLRPRGETACDTLQIFITAEADGGENASKPDYICRISRGGWA